MDIEEIKRNLEAIYLDDYDGVYASAVKNYVIKFIQKM